MLSRLHFLLKVRGSHMDKQTGRLINWVLQKLSSLIGQQTTVHICDLLTKVKRIYEPSFLLFHAEGKVFNGRYAVLDILC